MTHLPKYISTVLLAAALSSAAQAQTTVSDMLQPLPAGSIRLTDYLQDDIINSVEHWNKSPELPYGSFVDFFRKGRPQFALGEMWGKAVRSGCMLYRYTRDPELKAVMDATVADMLSAQRSNGSFCCVPPEMQPDNAGGDLWERKYVLLGFDEYYENVSRDPRVLKAMMEHADCIIDQIGPAPKTGLTDLGWSPNHIESSTLLEPFMRLYKLTGERRYLDFATYIVSTGGAKGYDILRQAYDNVPPHMMGGPYPKAYEMLSLFEGLVEYYRVTGDTHWKDCFMNLYRNVRDMEITIVGNAGADQPYHPAVLGEAWSNTALEQTNPDITRMMETCVGVTWMKFCSQILRLTGDGSVVDEIEKYVYNGLLGAMKPEGDGFSYVNLLNGQKVTNYGWGWDFDGKPVTCCNLNGPMGLAYIPFVAIMQRADGPVINLYNACEATASTPKGGKVGLTVETAFPRDGHVKVTVNPEGKGSFSISLRRPSWTTSMNIRVNGKPAEFSGTGDSYMTITRKWKKGDVIEADFGMQCVLIPAPHGSNRAGDGFQALKWGPIVLARDENIDPDYDHAVRIPVSEDGTVNIRKVGATREGTRMEFEVPTSDGPVRMVDFSSVDCWKGSRICTWMPVKEDAPAADRRYFFLNDDYSHYNYETIRKVFGPQKDNGIAVGNAILIYIFHNSMENYKAALEKHFKAAEEYDIPVIVELDPLAFWTDVPELWNWWDPSKPGFSDKNRNNVEWHGWGPEHATKIGWLNWGRQIRILPMMNLFSPEYQAAVKERMDQFLTWIEDWYRSLPEEKRYLLAGVKVTGEFAFGVNNWYYENGNGLLDRPESEDPTEGIDMRKLPDRGAVQTGYAALSSSGIRTDGEITAADIFRLEKEFGRFMAEICRGRRLPREMFYLHAAGVEGDLDSPIQEHVCPSWSFYHEDAVNPQDSDMVLKHLPSSDAPCWAVSEWNHFKSDGATWEKSLTNCYSLPGCRFVTVFNYDSVIGSGPDGNPIPIEGPVNALRKLQKGELVR